MPRFFSLALTALVAASPMVACISVSGDRILAKDLAEANPLFASLHPDLIVGFSPRPGITRMFRAEEQSSFARKHGLTAETPLPDVCFVGAGESPTTQKPANREVERGERIAVEVSSGTARVMFQAEAASAGRTGDSIVVKNPENGKLFSARVQGKGKVMVQR
ncbi:MAG: flagella basal body P-ring formation protein FlgA [Bryobacteraceae bacterium]